MSSDTNKENLILTFFRHHLWSNLRLFEACLPLTGEQLNHADPGTYGSIRATLTHLLRSEEYYLFLLTGEKQPTPESDDQTPIAKLKERVGQSSTLLLQTALNVQPDELVQVGEGAEIELIPNKVFLLQALHHAHEHRTQITTLLGQLGIEPPRLSGWAYFDDEIAPQQ